MNHIQKIELLSYNADNGVLITVLVKDENDVIKHKEECFNTLHHSHNGFEETECGYFA